MTLLKKCCQFCNGLFTTDKRKRQFCSVKCRKAYLENTYIHKSCKHCGFLFQRSLAERTKFCSDNCEKDAKRKRQVLWHRRNYKHYRKEKICIICQKKFIAQHPHKKTCSDECKEHNLKRQRLAYRERRNFIVRKHIALNREKYRQRNKEQYKKHREKRIKYAMDYYYNKRSEANKQDDLAFVYRNLK